MNDIFTDITALALESGFHMARVLSISDFLNAINTFLPSETAVSAYSSMSRYFGEDIMKAHDSYSLLVCALSCYRDESLPGPAAVRGKLYGIIAPFARRNYYKEATERLKAVYRGFRGTASYSRRNMHIFCNSRLPEKLIAWASGLGGYGKNSLIINKALGSQFVICGLLLDTRATSGIPHPDGIGALCGECNECITACPVGAIGPKAIIDGSKCMQFLATRIVRIPESILGQWGQMIYGCEICQDACPYNRSLSLATLTERGHIGPVVSLDMLLTMTTDEIKAYFKKTALGLSWIDPRAIQRNALIASGNSHNQALLPAVRSFLSVADPQIREVAEWAIQRIQQFSFWTLLPDKSKRNI